MRHVLGSHTIFTGGIDMAVRRAANAGLRAVQIFTTSPQYYGDRAGIGADRVARFHAALGETGISPEHVLVHAAYVLSVATPDPAKYARATSGSAAISDFHHVGQRSGSGRRRSGSGGCASTPGARATVTCAPRWRGSPRR